MSYNQPILSRAVRSSGVILIAIVGDLDTFGTRSIEGELQAALPDRTASAIIELSGVNIITSAALAMFVVRAQAMRHGGGKLALAGARGVVREVLVSAGFHSIFPIYTSIEQALVEMEA
jgi:anti-anti-sigma factor